MNVLDHLVKMRREQRAYFDENEWLTVVEVPKLQKKNASQMHFDRADENKDGILTFAELWELLHQLEIELSEKDCRQKFQVGPSKIF